MYKDKLKLSMIFIICLLLYNFAMKTSTHLPGATFTNMLIQCINA
jgi:hypothetical protein